MMGGVSQMIWGALLSVAIQLGFAYLIWVFAAKEKGALKITGMVISAVITLVSVIILISLVIRISPFGAKPSPMGPGGLSREQIEQMMKERGIQQPTKPAPAPAPKTK